MIEYIPINYDIELDFDSILSNVFGKVGICATVQYLKVAKKLAEFLKSKGIEIVSKKCASTGEEFQVLGCDATACDSSADMYIYIGDGKFHPIWIQYKTGKKVLNAISNKFVDDSEVNSLRAHVRAAYLKFVNSEKVGVIVSLKPGQNRLELAKSLRTKFPNKKFYILVMNDIDANQLNDFPVDIWVNTACPRLIDERDKFIKPIINVGDLLEMGPTFSQR